MRRQHRLDLGSGHGQVGPPQLSHQARQAIAVQRQQWIGASQQHQAQVVTAPPDEAVDGVQDTGVFDQVGAVDHQQDAGGTEWRAARTVFCHRDERHRQPRDPAVISGRQDVGLSQRSGQQGPEPGGLDIHR